MSDRYLFVGEHAAVLHSGGHAAPGDTFPEDAIDLDHDADLVASGALLDLETVPDPPLDDLSRADLDAVALTAGIESPDKLPNKDAVIAAIKEKTA